MFDNVARFFSLPLTELTLYDIFIVIVFCIALILTIIFSLIIVATKVRKLDNNLKDASNYQSYNNKAILNNLDIIIDQLSNVDKQQILNNNEIKSALSYSNNNLALEDHNAEQSDYSSYYLPKPTEQQAKQSPLSLVYAEKSQSNKLPYSNNPNISKYLPKSTGYQTSNPGSIYYKEAKKDVNAFVDEELINTSPQEEIPLKFVSQMSAAQQKPFISTEELDAVDNTVNETIFTTQQGSPYRFSKPIQASKPIQNINPSNTGFSNIINPFISQNAPNTSTPATTIGQINTANNNDLLKLVKQKIQEKLSSEKEAQKPEIRSFSFKSSPSSSDSKMDERPNRRSTSSRPGLASAGAGAPVPPTPPSNTNSRRSSSRSTIGRAPQAPQMPGTANRSSDRGSINRNTDSRMNPRSATIQRSISSAPTQPAARRDTLGGSNTRPMSSTSASSRPTASTTNRPAQRPMQQPRNLNNSPSSLQNRSRPGAAGNTRPGSNARPTINRNVR